MEEEHKIEHVKWILERNLSWVSQADIKASIIITTNLAMFGGLAGAYSSFSCKSSWSICFLTLTVILEVLSAIYAATAISPRLTGPSESLIFFGAIIKNETADSYNVKLKNLKEEDLLNDLSNQIHRNAEIASTKFNRVKKATIIALLSVGLWIFTITTLFANN